MKKAVVDIDGILWNIHTPWNEVIKRDFPECPLPGEIPDDEAKWKFYEGYMTDEEMHETVKEVHMRQPEFMCFQDAGKLTKVLQNHDYYVTIASHRHPDSYGATKEWLDKRDIPFDELYTGPDKHFLLEDAVLFIDDSPVSHPIAVKKGVTTFSIKYNYNHYMEGVHFYPDFFSLKFAVAYWLKTGEQAYDRKPRRSNFNPRNLRQAN